jgi:thiol:disulfide interchange protein DsbD
MSFLKKLFLTLCFVGFSLSAFEAQAQIMDGAKEPDNYVQARVIANQTQVQGGETIRLGLEQTIYPGWHTYWLNPGDSGTPTSIDWELPPSFSVSDLEWPAPQKIPFGPLTNYGYEGQVTLLQNLTIPDNVGTTPFALNGTVNLLVCHDICIPETHDVFIAFNTGANPEPQNIAAAESKLPLEQSWNATFTADGSNLLISASDSDFSIFNGAKNITLNPEDWGAIDNNASASLNLTNTSLEIRQTIGERDLNELETLPIVVTFENAQGNNQAVRFTAAYEAPFVEIGQNNNSGDITVLSAILFALLGGIILNLMPCVFPVLSMKALSLVNIGEKEEKKARGYGLSYTAGILITFAIIGGALLILKSTGAQIGWGFQLQNPLVIISLTYLIFLIGLNLTGFFEFTSNFGKLGSATQKLSGKEGHKGAFFTGVLATLVATPCTAPFMGAALGFALTQSAIVSMIVFLALGLGLALPYLALCFIPALRSKLPKPGAWMLTFKQFLSFPMFLTAAWLVWVLTQQSGAMGTILALTGIIAITFVIWVLKNLPKGKIIKSISMALIVISFLFIGWTFFCTKVMSTGGLNLAENQSANWSVYSPESLEEALASNDPVFTNMTAAWCITCKVNERVALDTGTTKALFKSKNIQYLKGDWTNQDPDITAYLNEFGRQGVPLYVYYGAPDNQTGQRPEPVVLPQLLTSGLVQKTIQ